MVSEVQVEDDRVAEELFKEQSTNGSDSGNDILSKELQKKGHVITFSKKRAFWAVKKKILS